MSQVQLLFESSKTELIPYFAAMDFAKVHPFVSLFITMHDLFVALVSRNQHLDL